MFFLAADARAFIATSDVAEFELQAFTGSDQVEIEHDGHCGFVINGKAYFLTDNDLISFANQLKEA